MRYLIREFDLDDVRWLVLCVLAVSLFHAWDHTWELEAKVARIEAARDKEPEPEPMELREDECGPTATEWGTGSIYSEPESVWDTHLASYPRMPVCR